MTKRPFLRRKSLFWLSIFFVGSCRCFLRRDLFMFFLRSRVVDQAVPPLTRLFRGVALPPVSLTESLSHSPQYAVRRSVKVSCYSLRATSTVKKDLGSLPCLKVIGLFPTHGLTMYYGPSRKRQWWPLSSVWDKRVLSDLTETPHTSTGLFQLTRCC